MVGDAPDPLFVEARRGLLDALGALQDHLDGLVLVGAQAIYMHTDEVVLGVALRTKDADIAIVPPVMATPDIAQAMIRAGFKSGDQPGMWLDEGRQVDLLVPESLADPRGKRAARLAGHGLRAARKVAGIEGAAVDNAPRDVAALDPGDLRRYRLRVAGPGALLISKVIKLAERERELHQNRLYDKDALDVYRLLRLPTELVAERIALLQRDERSVVATRVGLAALRDLFATPDSMGSELAGRAVAGVGDPEGVRLSVSALARDLIEFALLEA